MSTALIIVDVQNDFLPAQGNRPEGSLAVPEGNEVIPVIKGLLNRDQWSWNVVIATQDYHPPRHISFASRHPPHPPFTDLRVTDGRGRTYLQTLWPDHCVQGTKGAEIEKELRKSFKPWKDRVKIVRKACYPDVEAYSAFEGYITEATDPEEPPSDPGAVPLLDGPMTKYLREQGVEKVVITGHATDFCINQTSMDAIAANFDTLLVAPCMRAVFADRVKATFDNIEEKGGKVIGREEGDDWVSDLRAWVDRR